MDVFVHHDNEATDIVAAMGAGRQQERLFGVSGIGLFYRDDIEQTPTAKLHTPHALYAR